MAAPYAVQEFDESLIQKMLAEGDPRQKKARHKDFIHAPSTYLTKPMHFTIL